MDRIDGYTTTALGDQFTEGDGISIPPTQAPATWLNAVQEEICNAIEGLGGALNIANNDQLLTQLLASFGQDLRALSFTHEMTADADYVLTDAQNQFGRMIVTDVDTTLTATRNIILSDDERMFFVQNDTSQTLTFKTAAGVGIAISPGVSEQLHCDGVDVISTGQSDLVKQVIVSGGAVTAMTIDGLDSDIHGTYYVEALLNNATASSGGVNLFVNGDTTQTNYHTQTGNHIGLNVNSQAADTAGIASLVASLDTEISAEVRRSPGGYLSVLSNANRQETSGTITLERYGMRSDIPISKITSLTISTDVALAIGDGSIFNVYRRR